MIVNSEGQILDISAGVIHFLKLDLLQIKKNPIFITDYIPNILHEKEKYLTNVVPVSLTIYIDNQEIIRKYNCEIGNIDFFMIEQDFGGDEGRVNEETKIQKNFGFWIKLEQINNETDNLQLQVLSPDKAMRTASKTLKKDVKLNFGYKTGNLSPESIPIKFRPKMASFRRIFTRLYCTSIHELEYEI